MNTAERRQHVETLFEAALAAIEPERLIADALAGEAGPVTVIAIGKAAPAMCRGAAAALGTVTGLCVSDHEEEVPPGIELLLGDHPVPESRSFAAGRAVLNTVAASTDRVIALISGGGSALCELPIDGVSPEFLSSTTKRLLESGAPISEINLVRRHLSAVKGGGVSAVAKQPVHTYAISDVCAAAPSTIASGPTIHQAWDPEAANAAMRRLGIDVPQQVRDAMRAHRPPEQTGGRVDVVADGRTAATAVAATAEGMGIDALISPGWLTGPVDRALSGFLSDARAGELKIGAGEPEVEVRGQGSGGRNTHAALLAARMISDSSAVFAALATDGVDGHSGSAGAIVDGTTIARGGDPSASLDASDSGTYLRSIGDLVVTGPTGTNVADLWLFWP